MFKVEINSTHIEKAISDAIGEPVRVIEGRNEQGNREIRIVRKDKKTDRYTDMIYVKWIVIGDIYKAVVMDLLEMSFAHLNKNNK